MLVSEQEFGSMWIKMLCVMTVIVASLVGVGASTAVAQSTEFHNPINALDVDGNNLIQPLDALLIINLLDRNASFVPDNAVPLAIPPATYYYDTNDDTNVTPLDALLVINHLIVSVPEPSTFVLGGFGLLAMAVCARRRLRRKALAV
ncbi:MAG TPA: PEP-CTERM sorting domain-containing protein [Pirellulales bacterium]|nr:PEP-CTERM sorting domain-containing protein [Pirellulales bacterium]